MPHIGAGQFAATIRSSKPDIIGTEDKERGLQAAADKLQRGPDGGRQKHAQQDATRKTNGGGAVRVTAAQDKTQRVGTTQQLLAAQEKRRRRRHQAD